VSRALITGGAGFIGTHLAEHLAEHVGVVLFDNFRRDSLQAVPKLRALQVNILGTANLLERAAQRGIQRFVHFSTSEVFGPDAFWVHEESGFRIGPAGDAACFRWW
jgi:nucleoside-diphosphate-sugar epimerase